MAFTGAGTCSADFREISRLRKQCGREIKGEWHPLQRGQPFRKIGYKIREARLQKTPYMLVVGQKEEEEGVVSVRSRFKGDEGAQSLDTFIDDICKEIRTKEIRKVEVTPESK